MALKIIFSQILSKNLCIKSTFLSIASTKIQTFSSQPINFKSASSQTFPLFESDETKIISLTENEAIHGQQEKIDKDKATVKYEKIDGKSSIMTKFMVNVKSRKKRDKSGTILLEGKRLIQDAVDAGAKPIALFFSRVSDIQGLHSDGVKLYRVAYKDLQFWSDVSTTQGVCGIFSTPDTSKYDMPHKLPLTIICDNVRDPGNMGSVLRTAAAVGCQQLLLTTGCVDLWEPKVLRTAAGSHFRCRIHESLSWSDVNNIISPDSAVYLADSDVPEPQYDYPLVDVYDVNDEGEKVPVLSEPPKRVTAYQKNRELSADVPLLQYTEASYSTTSPLVLIIGGETQGLSKEAMQLAKDRNAARVFVPLENGVESLNSGTALGILVYEIRRQIVAGR